MSCKEKTTQQAATRTSSAVKIADVRIHPLYRELYGSPHPEAVQRRKHAYAQDPRLDGRVEVLPDGTLLAGEDYLVGAAAAGLDRISVVVNDTLSGSEALVAARIIVLGLQREETSTLTKARCLARAFHLQGESPEIREAALTRGAMGHANKSAIQHRK